MTINEAIIYAEEMAATDGNRKRQDNYNQIAEWLKDYKRMLQQEPAVIDACDQSINLFEAVDRIKELAPVTPQQKTGHWIADVDRWGDIVTTVNGYRCDKCNTFNSDKDNYCPNCGCRMVEPQESEEV